MLLHAAWWLCMARLAGGFEVPAPSPPPLQVKIGDGRDSVASVSPLNTVRGNGKDAHHWEEFTELQHPRSLQEVEDDQSKTHDGRFDDGAIRIAVANYMQYGLSSGYPNITDWDVAAVTDMSSLFEGEGEFNEPLNMWNTGQVTTMARIFAGARNFNQPLNDWSMGKVTAISFMFYNARYFDQDLRNWDTRQVVSMKGVFAYTYYFNQDVNSWKTEQVTDMRDMFHKSMKFNQDVSSWMTERVTDMQYMFAYSLQFNRDINNWNTGQVTAMNDMFIDAVSFNQPLGKWNTERVTTMAYMFDEAHEFNQDLNNWNTGQVASMSYMFWHAFKFNQSVINWDTNQVYTMYFMFSYTLLDQPINSWNTARVKQMKGMFEQAYHFNQDVDSWNTASVTDMANMFSAANSFNQDVDSWNTAKVTDMTNMFRAAASFDQNLDSWNVSQAAKMGSMFENAKTTFTFLECSIPDPLEYAYNILNYGKESEYVRPSEVTAACEKGFRGNAIVRCTEEKKPLSFDGCFPCETGRFANMNQCSDCPVGRVAIRGICEACPEGRFAQEAKATECKFCVAGKTSNEERSDCESCPPGRYSPLLESSCLECSEGKYSDKPQQETLTSCRLCEVGQYSSAKGATECQQCPLSGMMTMSKQRIKDQMQWIPHSGADNESLCGCAVDTRMNVAGDCVDCGEGDGVDCVGMGEFIIKPGYAAEAVDCDVEPCNLLPAAREGRELVVYKCYGLRARCKGGTPGQTCAAGREGISCAKCMAMHVPRSDGTCAKCKGEDTLVFVVACLGAFVLFVLLYYLVITQDRAKQNPWLLLCGMTGSIMLTLLQQLGLLSLLSLHWPEPLLSALNVIRILQIDIQYLNLNCVASTSSLAVYVTKLCAILIGIASMCLIHVLHVLFRHKGRFREHMPSLSCGLGIVAMIFYISVTSTVLEPLQCLDNPSGKKTVSEYQDVICYETEKHLLMVVVGIISLFFPLAYLTQCITAVRRFPEKMLEGDVRFLRTYAFLFFRYRIETYWFAPVQMLRSLLLSAAPIVPDIVVQLIAMQLLTSMHVAITSFFVPWRVHYANALEMVLTVAMLMMLAVACMLLEEVPFSVIANVGFVLICTILAVMPATLSVALFMYWKKKHKKAFDYFLCHHKSGSCGFTRLLRMHLQDVNRIAFLDSDNLSDLDLLFDYVAFDSESLLVICSRDILTRPWCVGEIVTAMLNRVKTAKVAFSEFEEPKDDFVQEYSLHVSDLSALSSRGIDLIRIQDALRWARSLQAFELPSYATKHTMVALVGMIRNQSDWQNASGQKQISEIRSVSTTSDTKVIVLLDHSNFDTNASALVLVKLLVVHTASCPELLPDVLPPEKELTQGIDALIIFCTNGAFLQPYLLGALRVASSQPEGCYQIPILVDSNFRFPTMESLRCTKAMIAFGGTMMSYDDVMSCLILDVFKIIALEFRPESTEDILTTQASQIAKRLQSLRGTSRHLLKSSISLNSQDTGSSQRGDDDSIMYL